MRPPPHPAFLAVAAALMIGVGRVGAQSGRDDDIERPEVRSLTLRGVKAVESDELRESISTDASTCRGLLFRPFCLLSHSSRWWKKAYLDRTELRRDVLRIKVFYWKRGYREAQVDTAVVARGRDEVAVTFDITEGPPTVVRTLSVIRPDSLITDRQIEALMDLRAGAPFNLLALDSSLVKLHNALWDRGYSDAKIDTATVLDSAQRAVELSITIDPRWIATIGTISVTGNERVTDRTIRNSLSIRPGDIYRRRELISSQRRLYESGMFRRAAIVVPPQGDTVKQIVITVGESPPRLARLGGGFTTRDFLQAEARFTQHNFLGGARRLGLNLSVGNVFANALNDSFIFDDVTRDIGGADAGFLRATYAASLDFVQPWWFSPRNSAGASIFAHRRSAPGVFVDRGYGASASLTRELSDRAPVSADYHFEVTRVEAGDVYFCINYGICDLATVNALRERQKLSPFALSFSTDRSNDPFSPTRGYVARVDVEHASAFTVSDFRYNRAFVDAAIYRSVKTRGVLAAHARFGWVNALGSTATALSVSDGSGDLLHPRKRFYAGGSRSVRGLGENLLGPRVLTIPPSKLVAIGCDTSAAAIAACDLSQPSLSGTGKGLEDRDFTPRPLGGNTLLEGSVEMRFPVWRELGGAVFLDGGIVGKGSLGGVAKGDAALTPGAGIRYYSPVGAIRIDLGFNPSRREQLPVITQVERNGRREIVQLTQLRDYSPTGSSRGGIGGVLSRFTLHLSIGQAY